jgi:hypothetical protein
VSTDAAGAVRHAHEWFGAHSGWAPPDAPTLAEWMADGVCRCPDECLVAPAAWCEHGLASWWLIVNSVRRESRSTSWDPALMVPDPSRMDIGATGAVAALDAHERAVQRGEAGYTDPATGLFVLTAFYLWSRGCCERGCRHCPFVDSAAP